MKSTASNVRMWLIHPLPKDVATAIDRISRTDDAVHVAVMPDVHLSNEVCVGTVLATRQLIYPQAVGGDIGCGMAALAFDADAQVIRDEARAARVLHAMPNIVPTMRHRNRDSVSGASGLDPAKLSYPRLQSIFRRDGVVQFGTLGRGNHFIEFQADEEDRLWLMLHSGSRAMGKAIRDFHLAHASQSSVGLRYVDARSSEGQAYVADMEWAREYARLSRRGMVDAIVRLMKDLFGVAPLDDSFFDCDHNHVRLQSHFGEKFWVHRKGAAAAAEGEPGIIPGSMGTESYHVEGRGCAPSLCSSSHEAGRAMSRGEAHKKFAARDLARQMRGVWYDTRIEHELRDEAPSAYKDIRLVMRAQRELTKVRRRLRPLLSYKGG